MSHKAGGFSVRFTIIAALALLIVAAAADLEPVENHTRWNDQYDVCMYFYARESAKNGMCYVDEEYCIVSPYKPNWFRDVDEVECTWLLPGEVNELPILTNVGDAVAREGRRFTLNPQCLDPEGGEVILTYEGVMTGAEWTPGFTDAGTYEQTVTCTDREKESVSATFTITVRDTNRPPVFIRPA